MVITQVPNSEVFTTIIMYKQQKNDNSTTPDEFEFLILYSYRISFKLARVVKFIFLTKRKYKKEKFTTFDLRLRLSIDQLEKEGEFVVRVQKRGNC